jgi:CheY-like chemotaxis protein
VVASSGEKALELLDASEGKYRALVTDINLGLDKIDGWQVAKHAREIDPDFPIVYMSGKDGDEWGSKRSEEHHVGEALCAGATCYRRLSNFSTLECRKSKSRRLSRPWSFPRVRFVKCRIPDIML